MSNKTLDKIVANAKERERDRIIALLRDLETYTEQGEHYIALPRLDVIDLIKGENK